MFKVSKSVSVLGLLAGATWLSSSAVAFEQHEAHVHGEAVINIVVENGQVEAAFKSPMMNIVGFEYEATSEADKAKVASALQVFQDAYALVKLPDEARCLVDDVDVHLGDEHEEHDHEKEHGHEEEHGHEKEHGHEEEHAHEEEHDHAHESEAATHSDVHAHYHFKCANPAALTSMELGFIEAFKGIEELDVNLLFGNKAKKVVLTKESSQITF